jgi:hypothetical protein
MAVVSGTDKRAWLVMQLADEGHISTFWFKRNQHN